MDDYTNDSDGCEYGDALAGRASGPCPACGVDADEHRRECDLCGSSWYPHDPATDDPATATDGDLCADCARELEEVREAVDDADVQHGVRRIVPPDDSDPEAVIYARTRVRTEDVVEEYRDRWDHDLAGACRRAADRYAHAARVDDLVGDGVPYALYQGVECDRCGEAIDADELDAGATLDDGMGGTCSACAERADELRGWWESDGVQGEGARRLVVGDGAVYVSAAVTLDAILDQYPWDRVGREDGAELTEAVDDAAADHDGAYWTEADEETVDGAYVHAVRYHLGTDWRAVVDAALRRALDDAGADAEVREAVLRGIVPSDDGTLGDGTHHDRIALDPDGLATQAETWVEVYAQMIDNVRRDEADEEVE